MLEPNSKKRDRALKKVLAEIAKNRTPIRQTGNLNGKHLEETVLYDPSLATYLSNVSVGAV